MGHKLVFGNSTSATVYSLPNTIIYLKAIKYLNIRLRQIRVWKIEDRMLYCGCKNLGLLGWKLKTLWQWLFLFSYSIVMACVGGWQIQIIFKQRNHYCARLFVSP